MYIYIHITQGRNNDTCMPGQHECARAKPSSTHMPYEELHYVFNGSAAACVTAAMMYACTYLLLAFPYMHNNSQPCSQSLLSSLSL